MVEMFNEILDNINIKFNESLDELKLNKNKKKITRYFDQYNSHIVLIEHDKYDELSKIFMANENDKISMIRLFDNEWIKGYRIQRYSEYSRMLIKLKEKESMSEFMKTFDDVPIWNNEF